MRRGQGAGAALSALLVVLGFAAGAQAKTLTVTTTADSGPGSLRQDVQQASAGDTIALPASTHHYRVFSKIQITEPITIEGAGAGKSVIQGGGATRIFEVTSGVPPATTVTIEALAITGGHTASSPGGGAILVDAGAGSLDVVDSVLHDNDASLKLSATSPGAAGGGAIYAAGAGLTITRSVLASNRATVTQQSVASGNNPCCDGGGAIYDNGTGPISISGSQFLNDTVTLNAVDDGMNTDPCCGGGGALYENVNQPLTIMGSTLSRNTATINSGQCCHGGGAVYLDVNAASTPSVDLESSHLDHNTVTVTTATHGSGCCSGGGALATFGGVKAIHTSFDFNSATTIGQQCCNGGGALMVDSGNPGLDFHRVDLSHNSTDVSGSGDGNPGGTCCNGGGAMNLDVSSPPLTLDRSTVADNRADLSGTTISGGGGIYEDESSPTNTYLNSTLAGNTTNASGPQQGGGAIYAYNSSGAEDNLTNVTIARNSAKSGQGGGILTIAGDVHLTNSIIANQSQTDSNCSAQPYSSQTATFSSGGHNIESANTCGLTGVGDQVNTAPLLGPLQANGRSLFTMALLDHSPAINAADNAACPQVDQRGISRPRPLGGTCDIGAYEDMAPTVPSQWVSNITGSGATLHAAVNPQNLITTYRFQYGRTKSYGSTTPPLSAGKGYGLRSVATTVQSLSPKTAYHYRVLATNQLGTTTSPDRTFTTRAR